MGEILGFHFIGWPVRCKNSEVAADLDDLDVTTPHSCIADPRHGFPPSFSHGFIGAMRNGAVHADFTDSLERQKRKKKSKGRAKKRKCIYSACYY